MELENSEENTPEVQANLYQEFNTEDKLPDFQTSLFLKKEDFVKPKIMTIVKPVVDNFGKPALILSDNDGYEGELRIGAKNWQWLKEKLGHSAKDIIGNTVKVAAHEFKAPKDSLKPMSDGLLISLELV